MNSSATSRSNCDEELSVGIYKIDQQQALTSSTSGSIFTFGSILKTKSCIDLLMLWSLGVFFLLFELSVTPRALVSSDRAIWEGVPKRHKQRIRSAKIQKIVILTGDSPTCKATA